MGGRAASGRPSAARSPWLAVSVVTEESWVLLCKGSILTKIIGTYKSEMTGNSAGNYVTLHEFHCLLICNGVK